MGTVSEAFTFVGEDSALYKEELRYTIVGTKGLIAWKVDREKVLRHWHSFILRGLRQEAIPKYTLILSNLLNLQKSLVLNKKAKQDIFEKLIFEKKTKQNFPLANKISKQKMQETDLVKVKFNALQYSSTIHNHQVHEQKFAKPLRGYVDEKQKGRLN